MAAHRRRLEGARAIAKEAAELVGAACQIANDNGGGQVVLSGAKAAVEKAMEISKARGVKRAVPLPVSAPFHCALMQPAADAMREALADAAISRPVVPVVANVTAAPVEEPEDIRGLLVEQVTGTVRWRESVLCMARRGDEVRRVRGGKVLAGLLKRIDPNVSGISVGQPADVETNPGYV